MTPWKNKVTLRSVHYFIRIEADAYLPCITVPSLLPVTPSNDRGMVDQFGDEIDTVVNFLTTSFD